VLTLRRRRQESVWYRQARLQAARPFLRHLSCRLRCGCTACRLRGASKAFRFPLLPLPLLLLLMVPGRHPGAALPAGAEELGSCPGAEASSLDEAPADDLIRLSREALAV